jgi:hypothetical protein
VAKRPPAKRPPVSTKASTPAKGGRPAGLFTWLAVGLVVVVVVALVIVKVVSGSPSTTNSSGFQAISPTVQSELTQIPASVFNTVGVTSPVAPVNPPIALKNQPALTATSASGATLPEVFYMGAEYCPFCAAQRWSTIIALSRFGTFKGLGNMTSSSIDSFPSTPTFTFVKATYSSKYLTFKSVEEFTNISDAATNFYTQLQKPTTAENANFKKYDTSKYIPNETAQEDGSIPYISMGNEFIVSGASYTPATLQNISRNTIAAGLDDPTNPVTQAIITSANYQTAALCQLTKDQPSAVCTSAGVMAAKKVMGLK